MDHTRPDGSVARVWRLPVDDTRATLARILAHVRDRSHAPGRLGFELTAEQLQNGTDSEDLNYVGVLGELAVHLVTGLPWYVLDYHEGPDVGLLEVRARVGHHRDLPIRPKDQKQTPVILATYHPGPESRAVLVHGFAWPEAARQDTRSTPLDRPGEAWVPQVALQPLDALPDRFWRHRLRPGA